MQDYRKLEVWRKAHQLTLFVYKVTQSFTANEQYNLTSQMRRAAYSIPMNIAEGCGKASKPDFARYLDISMGSASELDYQLLLAHDLNYLEEQIHEKMHAQLSVIRKMLSNLSKSVRSPKTNN
jgi:four helix bundle protein